MIMFDDEYDDDFNSGGLFFVVNSYMQRCDDIGDERMYEKC
jgi:hypothetical protein